MKRFITIALFLAMAAVFAITASAAVGTVIYAFKTDASPNMDCVDESWGEPAIHVDKNSPNTALIDYWQVMIQRGMGKGRDDIYSEDVEFDLYMCYDKEYIYIGVVSPDEHISGSHIAIWQGDGAQIWFEILSMMEEPYGPNGHSPNADTNRVLELEKSSLYIVNLAGDNKSTNIMQASTRLPDRPKVVADTEKNEIQVILRIPLDDYGMKNKDVHGMEFGITVFRMSSWDSKDEGFAGALSWGRTYDEYTKIPKSVNTVILWDPANGMPDGTAPAESEDTTPPATETDPPVAEPNLEGVSSWAKEEVEKGISEGLVPAELQKNYTTPVTRGQVAQMFINLLEKATGKTVDEIMAEKGVEINENAFTDTTDKAVLAANALGIINGTGNGKFSPDGTLKRAQIAAIINRVAKVMGVETEGYTHEFTDITDNYKWADSELGWPVYAGIINGVGGGKFNPGGDLTTEQAILITYRGLSALKK